MVLARDLVPRRRTVRLALAGIALAGLTLTGCGTKFKIVPVSGTVTVDGEPVANVGVNFAPLGSEADLGPGSSAVTDARGRFTLLTVSDRRRRGAVPGKHSVTLFEGDAYDPYADPTLTPEQVRAKLDDLPFKLPPEARDGSLTFEVPPDGTSEAHFEFPSAAAAKR